MFDIRDSAEIILEFTNGMEIEDFLRDDKTVYAVVRAFEIIGEATKNIPRAVQVKYEKVPWREMARMRDVLIHHYFGVVRTVIWRTASEQVPELLSHIRAVEQSMRK